MGQTRTPISNNSCQWLNSASTLFLGWWPQYPLSILTPPQVLSPPHLALNLHHQPPRLLLRIPLTSSLYPPLPKGTSEAPLINLVFQKGPPNDDPLDPGDKETLKSWRRFYIFKNKLLSFLRNLPRFGPPLRRLFTPPPTPSEPAAGEPTNPPSPKSDCKGKAAGGKESKTKEQIPAPAERTEFSRLCIKNLKELNAAVRTYGPNAPFTLSILEAIPGEGYMIPGEWVRVVQSVLTRGQFLSWKADFFDRCETITAINQKSPRSPSTTWTFEKLSGQGKYAVEARQQRFLIGLLAQTASAALGAW